MVKFIHCADLHLDSPFKSRTRMPKNIFEDLISSTYKSVTRMIDIAIKEQVDFIIIAGDVFDKENRTLKSETFLKRQFERLKDNGIFVYMLHGNHDPLTEKAKTKWPDNVSVFKEQVETFESVSSKGERIFLHGFSYFLDDTYENKLDDYPVNDLNEGIHIGILHGTYANSSHKQARYTEFNLETLNSKLYHYWALGHIHVREQLSDLPPIHYPGNIQGRNRNEYGDKGFLLVEGDEVFLSTTFVPVHEITFAEYTLDMPALDKHDVYQAIVEFKSRLREAGKKIIQLTLHHEGDDELAEADYNELLLLLHEDEQDVKDFIWIDSLTIDYANQDQTAILNDIKASYSDNDEIFKEALNSMYMDPKINRLLPPMNELEKEDYLELGEERLKMLMRK
ncbi:metallophosphoesterase family protein [Salinicoccus halitifaciens]|uniref:DNA repair exonuclease SbcCD nuclease subunit n=1 Tax=Salinicoccus halitifaciens TaxID=1073415 RepID=A0ABV2ECL8_9STAP|nr:DNA repair exonuclease [Salinicoccus halitifaciens]MCD2138984.1 DNA repair exonuclease [Salinicoccus halitifaciens]